MKYLLGAIFVIVAYVALFDHHPFSGSGGYTGQIQTVRIEHVGDRLTAVVKMKGDPARTFIASYSSEDEFERDVPLLKPNSHVILTYHGPYFGHNQTIDSIQAWTNR